MPAFNLRLFASSLMLLTAHLFLLSAIVEGFQNRCLSHPSSTSSFRTGNTKVFNSENNEDDDSSVSLPLPTPSSVSSQLEQGNFNPFDYQKSNSRSSRSVGSTARVDLRSLRMGSVTNDLLNALGDKDSMRAILEDNRDFLLEPLEVEDSVAVRSVFYLLF